MKPRRLSRSLSRSLSMIVLLLGSPAFAQSPARPAATAGLLKELNASVEGLTSRVSLSVVQVLASGYGSVDERTRGDSGLVIGRQHTIGSGAIIDPDGYIVTNAHVVAGARQVQVVVHRDTTADGPMRSLALIAGQTVDARVVGTSTDLDLALLKVDLTGLQALPFANYDAIRQGELVFAFGSPEGLRDSVSMGVVSSVARQADPDSPTIYIQTDAPINPGNSGGPLVNIDGELVGLNTFILTDSGGSQGLGFAIPSAVIAAAYPQLRKYGHLHRGLIGFSMQTVTPALAAGLGLSRTSGILVADVLPGSAAEAAGVGLKDLVTSINGKPVDSVPNLSLELIRYAAGETVTLGLLRGNSAMTVEVTVMERPHPLDELATLADPETRSIARLGIVGLDVGDDTPALLPGLRISSGVFVAARTQASSENDVPLAAGDIIHAMNSFAVRSVDGLRVLMDDVKANSSFVLQIERNGQLQFVTCRAY